MHNDITNCWLNKHRLGAMEFLKKIFTKKSDSSDSYQIFYSCNECLEVIVDGAPRYNCVECEKSYDLCQKCHDCGKAAAHSESCGRHHSFVVESQSKSSIYHKILKSTSLEELVLNMFKYYNARPAIGQYDKNLNDFTFLTYGDVSEKVAHFGSGLRHLMEERRCAKSMVSMCSICRLEWYLTDLACLLFGIPTVPLGATSTKEQMKLILNKAEVSVLICSLSTLKEIVKVMPECPTLKEVILMDIALGCEESSQEHSIQALPDDIHLSKFSEVMKNGKDLPAVKISKIKHKESDLYTIQFTSGSTGDPKGCIFSRGLWYSRISKGQHMGFLNIWLSFHPPSHNLERKSFFSILLSGGKVAMYRGSIEHLFDDFSLMRPTIIASTPRLWTVLYNQYLEALHSAMQASRTTVAPEYQTLVLPPTAGNSKFEHFDPAQVPKELKEDVMRQFKSKLGGRERLITTGGAPTAQAVKMFIIECFGGMVNDGYGSTEAGSIASDGHIFSSTTVKLVDVPEMGYWTTDNPPRGEICVKTSEMIGGYFKNPKATAEHFVEGYFRTGDIGILEKQGKIKIIDRKKNIFKLAQGEFVSPEGLEILYVGASHNINQMYIYGNSLQSNVLAVVVPEHKNLVEIARSLNLEEEDDMEKICQWSKVKEVYLKELQSIAALNSLPGWEVPRDIILEPVAFSVENGMLTSTMKSSRPNLEGKYRPLMETMYQQLNDVSQHRPLEITIFEKIMERLKQKEAAEVTCDSVGSDSSEDTLKKSFSQLGGDSLAAMHLSSLLREYLMLEIPVERILKEPLESVLAIKENTLGVNHNMVDYDWKSEASVDSLLEEVTENDQHCSPSSSREAPSVVLLTGSTGFLGRFVLWELLCDHKICKVFCVVQNKEGVSASDRVMEILHEIHSEMNCSQGLETSDKLVVLTGDLSQTKLGLSDENYTFLCQEVDTIVHCAAIVNSALPYSTLKKTNVDSTKDLLKMSMLCKPKFLHFVSTIGVYPPMSQDIDESVKPPMERLNSLTGYSQSKWVAESLVLAAIQQGKVCGNISRPGLIGPHSETGHANLRDWVCWLVRGLMKVGLTPDGCDEKQIYWIPVDQVAKAVVLMSLQLPTEHASEETSSSIFHLVNSSSPISFSSLMLSLQTRYSQLKISSYAEFRAKLTEQSRISGDVVLVNLNLLLPQGGWPSSPIYGSEKHKVQMLENTGIMLDNLHKQYVEKYLNFMQSHFTL